MLVTVSLSYLELELGSRDYESFLKLGEPTYATRDFFWQNIQIHSWA